MLVVISTKGLSKYEPAISSFNRSTHNAFKNCVIIIIIIMSFPQTTTIYLSVSIFHKSLALAVTCHDVFCKDPSHISALTKYINDMSNGCLLGAKHTVPVTSLRATRGHIPAWSEDIEPRRRQSMFWHDNYGWTVGAPGLAMLLMLCVKLALHIIMQFAMLEDMNVIKLINVLLMLLLIITVVTSGERLSASVVLVLAAVAVLMD